MAAEKRSPGRPRGSTSENPRGVTKRQRWTEAEWAVVEQAAGAVGVTPSEFVRQAVLTAAAGLNR